MSELSKPVGATKADDIIRQVERKTRHLKKVKRPKKPKLDKGKT